MKTKLESFIKIVKKGWKVFLMSGGEETEVDLTGADFLKIVNERFGTLFLGQAPGGSWDQWSFHEKGGGGAVSIPYVLIGGQIYIGMVKQKRPLQSDEPVWNVPRGFLQDEHGQTAKAEFKEETGVVTDLEFVELIGDGINPNSAFFETWGEDEGVKMYAIRFPAVQMEEAYTGIYQLKGNFKPLDKAEGFVKGLTFVPLEEARKVGDMFTLAAIGRLLSQEFNFVIKE